LREQIVQDSLFALIWSQPIIIQVCEALSFPHIFVPPYAGKQMFTSEEKAAITLEMAIPFQ
jgi:hypothetical protein